MDERRSVILHASQRFVLEGLRWVCEEEPDLDVVAVTTDVNELAALCSLHRPAVVLVEIDHLHDAGSIAGAVLRSHGLARVVGLQRRGFVPDGTAFRRVGFWTVVRHDDGLAALLEALRGERLASITRLPSSDRVEGPATALALTPREHDVLAHIANGCNTMETSERLGISAKTVENHKQRMFRKLGVQSQAHAVSVAMRHGLLHTTLAREA